MTTLRIVKPIRMAIAMTRAVFRPRRSAERLLDTVVPAAVAAILRRIDLTTLVMTHLDVEKVLATVDLPELIRESTGSMIADSVYRVRMRGIAADEALRRLLHRPR